MKKRVFIIGTGRSGTHWLGHILNSSPDVFVNFEKKPIFGWVTQAALNKSKRKKLLPFILTYYILFPLKTRKIFAEKSHPNLWLVEYLNKYIPNSYFIGIIRNPYSTVSSMLLHQGVLKWIKEWEKYPVPNDFLGITTENMELYAKLSIEAKCTMRWIAHKERLEKVNQSYPTNSIIIDYEMIFDNPKGELRKIQSFLNLKEEIPMPVINTESKEKWKNNLTANQIKTINQTLTDNNLSQFITDL